MVISFDVGNTLIEPWPSVGAVYAEVAARHGAPGLDPDRINGLFLAAWFVERGTFRYRRADWQSLVQRTMSPLHSLGSDPVFFDALYEHFAGPEPWMIYDDVLPTLKTMQSCGIRIIATSNWDDRLRPLLVSLGLASYFEFILVSGEEGVHKPDPELFLRASRRLGVDPGEILHIGDSLSEDVAGATAAGCQAVHLVRDVSATTASDPAGRYVRLSNLGAVLDLASRT